MAFTINYNGTNYSLWSSSSKITTPSLIIDGSNYVPLASGNIGDWKDIQGNGFQYQLSPLLVDGSKRAAYARRFVKNISGTLSGNITGTATTTSTTSHTVTSTKYISKSGTGTKGTTVTAVHDNWYYGVTFNAPAPVYVSVSGIGTLGAYNWQYAEYSVTTTVPGYVQTNQSSEGSWSVSGDVYLSATGTISTTVGTSESKSITVSKTDSYGVTYPSTPSILNLSGASIQSQGTSSTTVSAVLTGTVNYGQTLTLTRAYSYTVLGAI